MFIRLTKLTLKTLTALLATLAALYLVLLLINLNDQAPSADANTLQQLQQQLTPQVEQHAGNNGYLYLIQFEREGEYQLSEPLAQLQRQCDIADCHAALVAEPRLTQLVSEHQALLDFYQQLRSFNNWYEPVPVDAAQTLPSFKSALNGQYLLLLQAWLAAQRQDIATAQQLLEQDFQFWRSLQTKHNLLLSKLLGATAIKRHFHFAASIQQQLNPEQYAAVSPGSWHNAFSERELSMLQVISAEWLYGNNVTEAFLEMDTALSELKLVDKVHWLLLKPLFQAQASRNQRASMLLAQAHGDEPTPIAWYSWLYNPTGKLLNSLGTPNLDSYQERFAELETLRQQAVAAEAGVASLL